MLPGLSRLPAGPSADPRLRGMRAGREHGTASRGCSRDICGYRHSTPRMGDAPGLHRGILFPRCQEAERHGRAGAGPVGSVGCGMAHPVGLAQWDRAPRPEELRGGGREHSTLQRGVGCKYFTNPVQSHEAAAIRAGHVRPEQAGIGIKSPRQPTRLLSPGMAGEKVPLRLLSCPLHPHIPSRSGGSSQGHRQSPSGCRGAQGGTEPAELGAAVPRGAALPPVPLLLPPN